MKKKWGNQTFPKTTAWILSAALVIGACPVVTNAEESVEKQTIEEQSVEDDSEVMTSEEGESSNQETSEEKSSERESTEETEEEENASEEESEEEFEEETSEIETSEETQEQVKKEKRVSFYDVIGNVTRTCPTIGKNGEVTFHYYPETGEEVTEAYVKGSWDSSWTDFLYMSEKDGIWSVTTDKLSLSDSYEYGIMVNNNWKGDPTNPRDGGNSQILRNPVVNQDGSVTIYYYPQGEETVSLCYTRDKDSKKELEMKQDATHSALLSATVEQQGAYSYYFLVDGSEVSDDNCVKAQFEISDVPADDVSVLSPVINGKEVTFHYYGPNAKKVFVAGEMNNWNNSADPMNYNEKTGFWSLSMELDPGTYQYKFVVDGNWLADPRNDKKNGENSEFSIAATNDDIKSPVMNNNNTTATFNYYNTKAKKVSLAGQMNGWNKEATPMTYDEETGFWSVDVKLQPGTYEYKFVIDGEDWKTDPRNKELRNNNSLLTIEEKTYTYHIYYYSKDFSAAKDAALWIWQDGGAGGILYDFDEMVTLKDGNKWLSADVNIDLGSISIIPRQKSSWDGQDLTKVFANEADEKDVTIYLVDDDKNVYTELPDVNQAVEYDRYVLIEYQRANHDYDGWNIYSWNTGLKSEFVVDFTEVAGKTVAYLPVDTTKESVSFCMRRSEEGNAWAEKDGGDHCANIPLDQNIVKVRFIEGQGVVGFLPYNVGYETNTEDMTVSFYYRDDEKYKSYEEDSLTGKVSFIYDGKEQKMEYDAENERYVAKVELSEGDHAYGYLVDGELVLDAYNTEKITVDGTEYSLFTYKQFAAELSATVSPKSIDYSQNAVLSISLGDDVPAEFKVVEISADLSALGLSADYVIDPALMAGTIAVKDTIPAGEKDIQITVKDQFGNVYKTTTTVEVVSRNAQNDFDWDEAVIYFTVTDRFFDGDSTNNDPYGKGTYDSEQGSMYHGGDFAGLTQKLDYLKKLGVNTVWITPIVENTEYLTDCDGHPTQKNAGYHGYWASDFTSLNKHLGTEQELELLINELHKRGMKLMVDVVLNHAGYTTEDLFNDTFISGKNMFRDASTTVKGDDQKDALSGLPDFVTEDREVSELLVEWQTSWISKYDIDYYRVDTVKHVDNTTWKAFKNALTEVNPSFKMIGEYAGAGYATSFGQLGTGQMDALLDFDFNDQALAFVNGDLERVEGFLESRNSSINNTATMGSFIGSHDEDGFMYRVEKEQNKDHETAYALTKVAATLQITAKGQPVIYYGEELGQTGANNYPYQENRYDFAWAKANNDNDMLVHYQKLLAIRNANTKVFAKGNRKTVALNQAEGTLVMARSYGEDTLYVGFNVNPTKDVEIVIPLKANTTYTDLYAEKAYTADEKGQLLITIPAAANGGTVVLKEGKAGNSSKDENIDVSNIVNNNADTVTVSIDTPKLVRWVEPTFTKMDGTVVRGWLNVVKEAYDAAMMDAVPLASTAQNAKELLVDIALSDHVIKMIPQNAVNEMKKSGATYRFIFNHQVTYEFDQNSLANVQNGLNLDMTILTDKDLGQGFQALIVTPKKADSMNAKVYMNFGKEQAGKVAFVFQRDMQTKKVEYLTFTWIDAYGNIKINQTDYTDLIVLY